jgi:hypothetical protein
MNINELRNIIMNYGDNRGELIVGSKRYTIDGCRLLEYVEDVGTFVSLLRSFFKWGKKGKMSFVDDHPNPVEFILSGVVSFSSDIFACIYIGGTDPYYFEGTITHDNE